MLPTGRASALTLSPPDAAVADVARRQTFGDPGPADLIGSDPQMVKSRLTAGALALMVALGLPVGITAEDTPSPSATPSSAESPSFTVGMTEDIDSANPFTGIAAVSYEIFQMEYPTLTEYYARRLPHRARPRRVVAGVGRPHHLDLQDPARPHVVATACR